MRAVNLGTTMNRGEGGDAAQADDGQPQDWDPEDDDKFGILTVCTVESMLNLYDSCESIDDNDGYKKGSICRDDVGIP